MLTKKTMLSKSFKAAKCKTSLKLAVSRIKLLKNKREIQVKQLRRELAQLLESGQEQTARIRVEHVVREEKTMSAYDLIEIYCELIVARLPIIESQKNCPIDLKEAISSVIFASPRCADIPELMDIRKHFVAKYGKDFVTSALELRPDCGVNRMIVEKLSANAPDTQTKAKTLLAVAKEHDIKWDSKGFEELQKPMEDLLNVPSKFSSANKIPMHPLNVNFSPVSSQNESDSKVIRRDTVSMTTGLNSSSLPNVRTSSPQVSSSQNESSASENKPRSSDMMHSYPSEEITLNRTNWRIEFKDAASAAQAAAESAEKASIAARAAAEFASRGNISRQNSNESHGNISNQNSNERNGSSIASSLDDKSNRLMSSKFKGSESGNLEYCQVEGILPKDELRGIEASTEDVDFSFYKDKMEIFDNSMESFPATESLADKQSYNEVGSVNEYVKVNYDRSASASSTETVGDDSIWVPTTELQHGRHGNLEYGSSEIGAEERLFGYGNEHISIGHTAAVFDAYDPEVNDAKGDLSNSFLTEQDDLASRLASIKTSATSNIFNDSHIGSHSFTEEKVILPKFDDSLRVTFDESDGYSSEFEDDLTKQLPTNSLQNTSLHCEEGDSISDSNETLPESALKSQSLQVTEEKAQDEVSSSSSLGVKDNEMSGNLAIGDELGLNFGRLTGGMRNRGYLHPPYVKSSAIDSSMSAKGSMGQANSRSIPRYEQEMSRNADQSDGGLGEKQVALHKKDSRKYVGGDQSPPKLVSFDSTVSSTEQQYADFKEKQIVSHKNSRKYTSDPNPPKLVSYDSSVSSTSDSYHFDKTQTRSEATSNQTYEQKPRTKTYKLRSPASSAYFDSVGDGREEESPNSMGSRGNASINTNITLSRRTRDFPPKARSDLPKLDGYSDIPNSIIETQTSEGKFALDSFSQSVDEETIAQKNQIRKPVKPNSAAQYPVDPKENRKTTERSLDPYSDSVNTGNDNPINIGSGTIIPETSTKKASHVHPKLPDYDTLAAHFQSLRSNRR